MNRQTVEIASQLFSIAAVPLLAIDPMNIIFLATGAITLAALWVVVGGRA